MHIKTKSEYLREMSLGKQTRCNEENTEINLGAGAYYFELFGVGLNGGFCKLGTEHLAFLRIRASMTF
jgi:hypothetical protein